MSDLPPAPGGSTPEPPQKKRKRDRATPFVLVACAAVLAGLFYLGVGDSTRTYPGRGGEAVQTEDPFDAAASVLAPALAAEDEKVFHAAMVEAETMTGCKPVSGAREITDPSDTAQATRLAAYIKSLESQGLKVGEADMDTPEGTVHQVIAFQC